MCLISDAGYFMYFDTSLGAAEESALLESRTLYPKRSLQCLQFFYKMTGSTKDRLVVWVKMDDGTGAVRKLRKIHTFFGMPLKIINALRESFGVPVFRNVFEIMVND